MSVAEFGLTPQASLISALPHIQLERPLAGSETLARHYEALSRLSISLVSLTREDLSRSIAAILRPLLDFDFLDVIVFKEGTSDVLWQSVGAGQVLSPGVPIEETPFWWVQQRQQPLVVADWKRDDRFAARRQALKNLGFEYRSLCCLPLRTQQGPLGVFSLASSRPHNYSVEEMQFLSLAAEQVALAVASMLHLERSRRAKSELDAQSARLRLLIDLTTSAAANPGLDDLLKAVTVGARRVIRSDFALVGLLDAESGRLQVNGFDSRDDLPFDQEAVDALAEHLGSRVFPTAKALGGQGRRVGPDRW